MDISKNNNRKVQLFILLFFLVAAACIRAPGLGKWCLTEDEYYYSQPVDFILEKGVPQYPSGGYYSRGFSLQYLTVIPAIFFKKWEFAVRTVPLLFGVLMVPLFYILASRFLGVFPAILCSTMLLLSSWHIEFSRFARFYAPFQFVFLLFIYSLLEGYGTGRRGYRILAFFLGLLSVTIDSYSIFMPIIMLSMIFLLDEAKRKTTFSIMLQGGILIAINMAYESIGFENLGVVNPLPPGTILEQTSPYLITSPVIFPNFGLLRSVQGSSVAVVGYLLLLGGAGYLLRKSIRHCGKSWDVIALVLSLSLPLLHQYSLLVFLLTILLINRRSAWRLFKENRSLWGMYLIGTLAYWVVIANYTGNLDTVLHFLVGFPPLKHAVFIPFKKTAPLFGAFLLAIVILATIHQMLKEQSWSPRFLVSLVLLMLLTMPVFYTFQKSTRYVFFFFPLILLLGYAETAGLASWAGRMVQGWGKRLVTTGLLIMPLILFTCTEDFHWEHIRDVSSAKWNFRMGEYDKLSMHWYPRVDFEGPSRYVNRVFSKGDVIIADHVVMTRYLERPYTNYMHYREPEMYPYSARKEGKEEKWTGRPLISRPEELAALVPADPGSSLWLIASLVKDRVGSSFMGTTHNVRSITEQYNLRKTLVFEGLDGRIGVWKITRGS